MSRTCKDDEINIIDVYRSNKNCGKLGQYFSKCPKNARNVSSRERGKLQKYRDKAFKLVSR